MAFTKGTSGNPAGRQPGTRNRSTVAVEALLEGEAEALARKAIEMALAGDTVALRLCLERVLPLRRGRPIVIDVGDLSTLNDLSAAQSKIVGAMLNGEITCDEAADAVAVVDKLGVAWERHDLDERIRALEERAPK